MIIKKIYIENFGKWHQTSFSFIRDCQLFYGENEAGKSTLYHFILTMLFGFPDKRKKAVMDYTSNTGKLQGGQLTLLHSVYGEVTIERFYEKEGGKATVSLSEGQVGDEKLLANILHPLTRELFQEIFTFQQQQLQAIVGFTEPQIQQPLLSIGLAGSEKLGVAKQKFIKRKKELYKLKGRQPLLNQKLEEIQQLQQIIFRQEQQVNDYQQLQEQLKVCSVKEKDLEINSQKIQSILHQTEQQLNYWTLYQEKANLVQRLEYMAQKWIDPQLLKELTALYHQDQLLEKEQLQVQLTTQSRENTQDSVLFQFYLANEQKFKESLTDQVEIEKIFSENRWLHQQSQVLQEEMDRILVKNKWQLEPLPKKSSQADRVMFQTFLETGQKLETECKMVEQKLTVLQESKQREEEKLSVIEDKLGESLYKRKTVISHQNKKPRIVAGAISSIVCFGIGFLWPPAWIVFFIVATLAILGTSYSYFKKNKKHEIKEYDAEKLQWQISLSQLDKWEEEEENCLQKKKKLKQAIDTWHAQRQDINQYFHYAVDTQPQEWINFSPEITRLYDLIQQKESLHQQVELIERKIAEYQLKLAFLEEWVPIHQGQLTETYQKVRHLVQKLEQKKLAYALDQSNENNWLIKLEKVKEQRRTLQNEAQKIIGPSHLTAIHHIPRLIDEQQQIQKEQQRLIELTSILAEVFSDSQEYSQIELERLFAESQQKIKNLKEELNKNKKKMVEIDYQIKRIETDGSLIELYQKEAEQTADIQELAKEWLSFEMALHLLEDSMKIVSDRQLPELLQQSGNIMSTLTSGRYQELVFIDNTLFLKLNTGKPVSLTECSTGTRDQLFMALRLSFVILHSQTCNCPVIIDDGWLHYDSRRKRNLMNVLKQISERVQVICFSSDKELLAYFKEEDQVVINLPGGEQNEKVTGTYR